MNCRVCGGDRFGSVLDLGPMPLVNNLLATRDQLVARYPLHVVYCRQCSLAQLTESPPPGELFDNYLYFSSQSRTMVEHARTLVDKFVRPGDRVLEIASNDGYLLKHAISRGATTVGVEPAANIAEFANSVGVPTRCAYFDRPYAHRLREELGTMDVIFANNVLAHVPNPHELIAGIRELLSAEGIAHIEVPSLLRMIQTTAFDTIYHEHFSYFSATALARLVLEHGLSIIGIDLLNIHGGSFHIQVARDGDQSEIEATIRDESTAGVGRDDLFADFAARVDRLRQTLDDAICRFPRVAAMGAAAKGIVLLNACGLTAERVLWVADVSPHKQGHFVPGTLQEIVSPQRLVDEQPDAALLLPWNIRDEILERNQRYRDQGGKFIVPIPEVEIL